MSFQLVSWTYFVKGRATNKLANTKMVACQVLKRQTTLQSCTFSTCCTLLMFSSSCSVSSFFFCSRLLLSQSPGLGTAEQVQSQEASLGLIQVFTCRNNPTPKCTRWVCQPDSGKFSVAFQSSLHASVYF